MAELRDLPFREVGNLATIDRHRHLRLGFPEVVLGLCKTAEQIVEILGHLAEGGANVLATRVNSAKADVVRAQVPRARYHPVAQVVVVENESFADQGRGVVLVASAGKK